MEEEHGRRRRKQEKIPVLHWFFRNNRVSPRYVRALQGHSGRDLIDPSLQDNVTIQCGLFHHIYHIGCAFNLHSIINNGLIPGEQDGASEFWKKTFYLRGHHSQIHNWSDDRWKACFGCRRRFETKNISIALIAWETILYFRALQGHSVSSLIDPTQQDNVLIGTGIIPYIYHVGCTFNFHSITNNGLTPGGQSSSKRQTVFFRPVDPMDNNKQSQGS